MRDTVSKDVFNATIEGRNFVQLDNNQAPSSSATKYPLDLVSKEIQGLLSIYLSSPGPAELSEFYNQILRQKAKQNTISSPTVKDLINCAHEHKIWNQDMLFHIQGILMYPHPDSDRENYKDFPYFGERLRHLNKILASHKPRSLRELWKDQRDTLSWWTFWLVVVFGIISVLLALGSLVVSAWQLALIYHPVGQQATRASVGP